MTSTFAVKIEVAGLVTEDDKGKTHRFPLRKTFGKDLVDELVRDDGTGILYFEWHPEEEDDGARTWEEGKHNAEHYRSLVVGAGLPVLTAPSIVVTDPDERVPEVSTPEPEPLPKRRRRVKT